MMAFAAFAFIPSVIGSLITNSTLDKQLKPRADGSFYSFYSFYSSGPNAFTCTHLDARKNTHATGWAMLAALFLPERGYRPGEVLGNRVYFPLLHPLSLSLSKNYEERDLRIGGRGGGGVCFADKGK